MTVHHGTAVPTCRSSDDRWSSLTRTHQPDCDNATCHGCEPCPERHCRVCDHTHVTVDGRGHDRTCATCLSETRTRLGALIVMSTALLGEAIMRSLNSTAAALAGPTADPETWTNRFLSAIAHRIDPGWLDDQVDLQHPAWVLGIWERHVRRHLGQTVSPGTSKPTLTEAHNYLDQHLTRLAQDPAFPFNELADDVRICHNGIERILHLEEHVDRGAPCPACGRANLRKDYGTTDDADRWTCPKCAQWWTETDYRAKVSGVFVTVATALTASQIRETYRVPEGSTRGWAAKGLVAKRGKDDAGRMLYDVADVLACRDRRAS